MIVTLEYEDIESARNSRKRRQIRGIADGFKCETDDHISTIEVDVYEVILDGIDDKAEHPWLEVDKESYERTVDSLSRRGLRPT